MPLYLRVLLQFLQGIGGVKQVVRRKPDRFSQSSHKVETDIPVAPFQLRKVGPVDIGGIGHIVNGQPLKLAGRPQPLTKQDSQRAWRTLLTGHSSDSAMLPGKVRVI